MSRGGTRTEHVCVESSGVGVSPWLWTRAPSLHRVLDSRPFWHVLIFLLALVSLLRLLTFDIIGGLLSALMLCMASVMISDGMQEHGRAIHLVRAACPTSGLCHRQRTEDVGRRQRRAFG